MYKKGVYRPLFPLLLLGTLLIYLGHSGDEITSRQTGQPELAPATPQGTQSCPSSVESRKIFNSLSSTFATPSRQHAASYFGDPSEQPQGWWQGEGQIGQRTNIDYRIRTPVIDGHLAAIHFHTCDPGPLDVLLVRGDFQPNCRTVSTKALKCHRQTYQENQRQCESQDRAQDSTFLVVWSDEPPSPWPPGKNSCHLHQGRRGPYSGSSGHGGLSCRATFTLPASTSRWGKRRSGGPVGRPSKSPRREIPSDAGPWIPEVTGRTPEGTRRTPHTAVDQEQDELLPAQPANTQALSWPQCWLRLVNFAVTNGGDLVGEVVADATQDSFLPLPVVGDGRRRGLATGSTCLGSTASHGSIPFRAGCPQDVHCAVAFAYSIAACAFSAAASAAGFARSCSPYYRRITRPLQLCTRDCPGVALPRCPRRTRQPTSRLHSSPDVYCSRSARYLAPGVPLCGGLASGRGRFRGGVSRRVIAAPSIWGCAVWALCVTLCQNGKNAAHAIWITAFQRVSDLHALFCAWCKTFPHRFGSRCRPPFRVVPSTVCVMQLHYALGPTAFFGLYASPLDTRSTSFPWV